MYSFALVSVALNIYNLEVESYILFSGNFWLQAWEIASQVTLRELFHRGKEGSQVTEEFCNKRQVVWTSKDCC